MSSDTVRPAGRGYLEIETADGWSALIAPGEIESVRGRSEGGSAIHLRHGNRPVLVDVPVAKVVAAMKGGGHATTT